MPDFSEKFKAEMHEATEIVTSFLPECTGPAKELFESMAYSVTNGGKRMRPVILRESFRVNNGSDEDEKEYVRPFMAALEFIHSYSLVHDDLPEMDNDMYRRGMLTTHAKFGHAAAVLAGDGLLNLAFETAGRALENAEKNGNTEMMKRGIWAFSVLAGKAGAFGMVGGQSVDVALTGHGMDEETLKYIYENKTSALLEAAFMIGGILAGADSERVAVLEKIGSNCGLAFQITDDILDEISTEEVLGKPIHSDAENNKTTYVTIHGLEKSKEKSRMLCEEAESMAVSAGFGGSFLAWLISYISRREK